MKVLLIFGNQLFPLETLTRHFSDLREVTVYMREDLELCTYYRFHKHKIILFIAAMRAYAEELKKAGCSVHYEEMEKSSQPYEFHFLAFLEANSVREVNVFEIEDKVFEERIFAALENKKLLIQTLQSPMFLCSRPDFKEYLRKSKKPFMKTFYETQRKKLNILIEPGGFPVGGQWSFDKHNRFPLPAKIVPPSLPKPKSSQHVKSAMKVCDLFFESHPGKTGDFWLPVDRNGARRWLDCFLSERLKQFGPYEDALARHSDFVFHSVLTPFLNTGLLTPNEVVQRTLDFSKDNDIPLQSVEGFVRQVIGWREFIRGIYQNFSDTEEVMNYWKHNRRLSAHWYEGKTGIPPLDFTLNKVLKYGYAHHIERLMVIGSLMLLLEVHPKEAHKWFMEMFVDSSDWVMGPNVYGMALFSDGGIFATKPYICGSNYYRKMGGYKVGDWCDGVDGLYWRFIEKHLEFFLSNPRLSMIARSVEKMDPLRKEKIFGEADRLIGKLTVGE